MRAGKTVMMVALVMALAGTMFGQQGNEPARPRPDNPNAAYKLDYVITEVENGKRVNTRTYTLLTDEGGGANMNMGNKVPVQAGDKAVQYMDVGLRIDARLRPRDGGDVWLSTSFKLSALIDQANTAGGNPALRTVEYSTATVVTPGKSSVIASGDDLNSQKKFELSVTVTKLK